MNRPRLILVGDAPAGLPERLQAFSGEADVLIAADDDEARALVGAGEEADGAADAARLQAEAARRVLADVRATLARVHHDANNPLAIIAGNAQLLVEVGGAVGLDEDLMQPIRDIDEASALLAGVLRRLVELRDAL